MRKIILFLSASLFALSSCNTDSESKSSDSYVLPKKYIYEGANGSTYKSTQTITYYGNRIVSIEADDGGKSTYTYTGNLITKIVNDNVDGDYVGHSITEYFYENDKLKSYTTTSTSNMSSKVYKYKTLYSYNGDGTILTKNYVIEDGNENLQWTSRSTIANGNLVKYEGLNSDGTVNYTSTYEYDDKSNPFRNVLGMDKLVAGGNGCVNNMTKITTPGHTEDDWVKTYQYGKDGFATEAKEYDNEGKLTSISTYIY